MEDTQIKGRQRLTDTDGATCVANPSPQLTWTLSWNSSVKSATKNYWNWTVDTDQATKRGVEKGERGDEEEWGNIPQSDDSESTDEWLSEEPEQHESTDEQDQN